MSENVFLFVPNVIGYMRIVLALAAFYFMTTNYVITSFCYLLSGLLDAFDGHAARHYNQSTKFGAMLDQLTDRLALMCFCIGLSVIYSEYYFLFQLSSALDIASHWLHLHQSNLSGRSSHKLIDLSGNPILRIYYTSKPVLFIMCCGNELYFCMLYLVYFTEGPKFLFDMGLFRLLMYISLPIMLVKALISLVHLITASKNMVAIDMEERSKSNVDSADEGF
ncbi:CDP-diacylglycerol--inositol 3-phosphatidyltransferase-like isoform X1 [Anneissia japonica]|uniref:CDP-diacylglycerol--inositol 3-phosphatidyltransferase-like isoform X1 n=2 Tax=Anneissia japonica TaxID=1529436 RepID=UPI001425AEA2|nr:CDP-diacylglycerol--inositol 3-phosphatidyltransferase-like isoform X1 [Anneissia japonica]